MNTNIALVDLVGTEGNLIWLLLQSTGIMALALLTVSVLTGVVSPVLTSPTRRLVAISAHSAAAATAMALAAGHIVLAVTDPYVDISAAAAIVPGVSAWGATGVGLGAAAVDLMIFIGITTALRDRSPVLWRRAHLLAYPMWALTIGHALTSATETAADPTRILSISSVVLVAAAVAYRLIRRARTRRGGTPRTTDRAQEPYGRSAPQMVPATATQTPHQDGDRR